jgi:hypothetical protein
MRLFTGGWLIHVRERLFLGAFLYHMRYPIYTTEPQLDVTEER